MDEMMMRTAGRWTPRLEWFTERSGVVTIFFPSMQGFFWLDLRSMEVVSSWFRGAWGTE
jgi:hypothetical protein